MIYCEHILLGSFNGIGFRLLKSPKIYQLSERSLALLVQQGGNIKTEIRTCRYLPDEQLIAISYLRPAYDEFQRKGVWNHTILIRITDYLTLTNPIGLFEQFFIKELSEFPSKLEAIEVKV